MNFLKPTRIKILGTVIVYAAEGLSTLFGGGIIWLLVTKYLKKPLSLQEFQTQDQIKSSLASILGSYLISAFGYLIKITFYYLAVCLIIYLLEIKQRKNKKQTKTLHR